MGDRRFVIAILQEVTTRSPFRYEQFADQARGLGLGVEYSDFGDYSLEAAKTGWSRAEELLRTSDAFVLAGLPIDLVPHLAELFHGRVDAGARAFVIPRSGSEKDLENSARFLSRYYMEPSSLKIVAADGRRLGIKFRSGDDTLRSPDLFSGVTEVTVDSPYALRCWGEAFPVMVAGSDAWGVDARTDYPDDWNGRELTCMGQWVGYGDSSVIAATATGIIDDPVTVMAGHLPGIENNERLSANIIQFLTRAVGIRRSSPTKPAPEDLCKRIEINLCDFVLGVVKSLTKDWWNEAVPLDIRQKASARQEEERSKFPKEAYLDVLDLKQIMRKNWSIFEPHFVRAGRQGGKDKALAFVDRLNEIRRLTGHPLKMHVSGYTFTADERTFLEDSDTLTLALAAPFMRV